MKPGTKNSFNCIKTLNINGSKYNYFSLTEAEKNGLEGISKLPNSLSERDFILSNILSGEILKYFSKFFKKSSSAKFKLDFLVL